MIYLTVTAYESRKWCDISEALEWSSKQVQKGIAVHIYPMPK